MMVSQTVETEEDLLTSLDLQIYHPQQGVQGMFCLLPVDAKHTLPADEPLKLGRDKNSCTFLLNDLKVSKKQLSLQAYRNPGSPEMLFCIKNLSRKARLVVNGVSLGHLERLDLPDKALVRFGLYELLIVRDPGEAKESFEVGVKVAAVSLMRDTFTCEPKSAPVMETMAPVIETMAPVIETMAPAIQMNYQGPLEVDETL